MIRSLHEKKTLFGNYKIFKSLDEVPEDGADITLNWIKKITSKDPLDFRKLSPTNFVKILFDLSLYENEKLVQNTFNLLQNSHSRRFKLQEMLTQIQILEDFQKKKVVNSIEQDIKALRELAETTENWYGDTSKESLEQTQECIRIISKLGNYLNEDHFHAEDLAPEDISISRKQFETPDENDQEVNSEFQVILRHLKAYEPIIDILKFEHANVQDGGAPASKIGVLREIFKFLGKFVRNQKKNQLIIMEHKLIYLTIMTTYHECGAEVLIEELFKNNKSLIHQTHKVEKFAYFILNMIADPKKCATNQKPRLLLSLQSLMMYNGQPLKTNQTTILSLLSSRDFKKIFVTPSDQDAMNIIETSLKDYNQKVNEENVSVVELAPCVDYAGAVLDILSYACDGKNAVTESKSQTSWPIAYNYKSPLFQII